MASITQNMRYRLSLIQYAERYGVSNAARKYKTNRQYIYRWKNRYDGSWDSLRDSSRRPQAYEQLSYPGQRVQTEVKFLPSCCLANEAKGKTLFAYKRSLQNQAT